MDSLNINLRSEAEPWSGPLLMSPPEQPLFYLRPGDPRYSCIEQFNLFRVATSQGKVREFRFGSGKVREK